MIRKGERVVSQMRYNTTEGGKKIANRMKQINTIPQ